jgi:putative DNA primase/helicase
MLKLAQSEAGIPVSPDDLDQNQWLLNCANGCLDLHTGEINPHDPHDLLTKLIPTDMTSRRIAQGGCIS